LAHALERHLAPVHEAAELADLPLHVVDALGSRSLYGAPIIWIKADKNHAGYPANSVTLVTNQIIKMLCFDAKESANGNSDRRNYGNNRYIYSNLRQWLNSDAAAGQWYTAQHSADAPPSTANVWDGVNQYQTLAGFLNGFTANERAALLATTITVGKSSTDGGGTETCVDKVFPLSCTEVNLSGDHVCGSKLAIFSDNSSRIATVTASCVANSNYGSNPSANQAWYYWLRDAYAGSAGSARCVWLGGSLSWGSACYGSFGLRPACNLSSDLLVSDNTDSDGCYTIVYNQPPTAPGTITVPSEVIGGEKPEHLVGTVDRSRRQPRRLQAGAQGGRRHMGADLQRQLPELHGLHHLRMDERAVPRQGIRHRRGRERLHHQRRAHRHQQPAARHRRWR